MPIIVPAAEATTHLETFLPFVLPQAKGCPDAMATFAIRQAIRELCQRALVWREDQGEIMSLADTTTYSYAISADRQVTKLLAVTFNGSAVSLLPAEEGRAHVIAGSAGPYAFGSMSTFDLHPAHTEDLVIQTAAAVMPVLNATEVPEAFEQYAEAIGTGALSRLLAQGGRDYTDPDGAMRAKQDWETHIARIRIAGSKAHSRAAPRTASSWF